jgi:hypothetical protein
MLNLNVLPVESTGSASLSLFALLYYVFAFLRKTVPDIEERSDVYLDLDDVSLGVKFRGDNHRVEVKVRSLH